ncbi:MAG TPA: response regulator [Nitrososphaeraceae archaeon]|nr:response regulator [Nitrososphaeraceae archaeon]
MNQYSFIELFAYVISLILAKKGNGSDGSTGGHQPDRARILIVDDEEDVTFFLKEALEGYGSFEVVTFNDPLLALSSFDNKKKADSGTAAYDLILLDIKMPKMDGFELYQKLQEKIDDDNRKKTKVCFMTAFEVYYDALKELFPDSYPSVCFIKKPFSAQDLVSRISKEMSGM